MGIILSTTQYAPFAFVTGIIGLLSFVFTLTTWLRVLWGNFSTAGQASHEVHAYLTNLRTELLEERASLCQMRKRCKQYHKRLRGDENGTDVLLDDASLKIMADTIKFLIKQFKEIERPFLAEGSEGIGDYEKHERRDRERRRGGAESVSPYYEHSAYASPTYSVKKSGDRARSRRRRRHDQENDDNVDDAETFWAQRTQYKEFGISCRFAWVQRKSQCQTLFQQLSRVQIRRIARQVSGLSLLAYEVGPRLERSEEMLRRIDDRLSINS